MLASLVATLYGLNRLVHARFGRVIEAIRENETRMEAIGFPTYRYKLVCFVIAGAVCGLAGALLANQGNFVSPRLLDWAQSGTLMIMVILGGVGHLYGGAIGAVVLLALEEVLSVLHDLLAAPGRRDPARDRAVRAAGDRRCVRAEAARLMALLEIRDLAKRFGGVVATDGVTLDVGRGEVHALIGPNGAGKTTLIHQISGALRPDRGRIVFDGADVTPMPFHERVRDRPRALLPDHQHLPAFTVLDNLALAGAGAQRLELLVLAAASRRRRRCSTRPAGCSRRWASPAATTTLAGNLAHGEQRQLEVGLALATNARAAAARRADGGHGPGRIAAHDRADRAAEARAHGAAGRARHGRGVPPRRPHLGAGQRARDRDRRAGGDPRERRK